MDQNYFTDNVRETLLTAHNELRRTVAEGNQPNHQRTLPPAKNMYELQYDCDMEKEVKEEIEKCSGQATLLEQYGQNFLVGSPISNGSELHLKPIDPMVHAKTLRFGCGYKGDCNNNADIHISCIYNLE
ncbi:SCP-like protein [Ancylostoma duodenale]|uniref:SCP-like protein n=1 Tax=Ancylostoma duodenale TaxID=51022 RepID=A0A0C2GXD2_9BILA|nr:SCP-like protein [Ancylostoma duodenale]